MRHLSITLACCLASSPAFAQDRAAENAVTQAEDAFGISIGREELGLYSSADVRGFSPSAAGNTRIDGLYFDQFLRPLTRIRRTQTIRIGIAAQGYLFPAPTGIVDYALRMPGNDASLSLVAGGDSYGNASIEADAIVPIIKDRLSVAFGATLSNNEFFNATDSVSHNQGILLRWTPSPDIEVKPFVQRSQVIDDEQGPIYIPAGNILPPRIVRRRYDGPGWIDYNSVGALYGVTSSVRFGRDTVLRAGLFRSLFNDATSGANLLLNVQPDGTGDQLIIADAPSRYVSNSGELRLSQGFREGNRLHTLHLSLRGRDRRQDYDGADEIDLGRRRFGVPVTDPAPVFRFGPLSRDRVRQWTAGIAYEGRWAGVGELGIGVQRTDYEKRVDRPDTGAFATRSRPWLFYGTAALNLSPTFALYGSYTQGLEESGTAPSRAVNRGEPVPAIRTEQIDGGVRWTIAPKLKFIAGVFTLTKPYFSLDGANRFTELGSTRNRGVELSLGGAITSRLDVVAGAVLLDPRVTGPAVTLGRVGPKPVGIRSRAANLNADWRLPGVEGVSLNLSVEHQGPITATTNNLVSIPQRTLIDVGGRYRFKLGTRSATLRVSVSNVTDVEGFDLRGSGAYDIIAGRVASAYLAVDL